MTAKTTGSSRQELDPAAASAWLPRTIALAIVSGLLLGLASKIDPKASVGLALALCAIAFVWTTTRESLGAQSWRWSPGAPTWLLVCVSSATLGAYYTATFVEAVIAVFGETGVANLSPITFQAIRIVSLLALGRGLGRVAYGTRTGVALVGGCAWLLIGSIDLQGHGAYRLAQALSDVFRPGFEPYATEDIRALVFVFLGLEVAGFATSVRAGELAVRLRPSERGAIERVPTVISGTIAVAVAVVAAWLNYLAIMSAVKLDVARVSAYGPGGVTHVNELGEVLELGLVVELQNTGRQPATLSNIKVEGTRRGGGDVVCRDYLATGVEGVATPLGSIRLEPASLQMMHLTCDMRMPLTYDEITDVYRQVRRRVNWLRPESKATAPRVEFPLLLLTLEARDAAGAKYADTVMLHDDPDVPHPSERVLTASWSPALRVIRGEQTQVLPRDFVRPSSVAVSANQPTP